MMRLFSLEESMSYVLYFSMMMVSGWETGATVGRFPR